MLAHCIAFVDFVAVTCIVALAHVVRDTLAPDNPFHILDQPDLGAAGKR